ncbi:MAG: UvrB/UvrC motif-containing protein [Akkermansiaceae bacterium]
MTACGVFGKARFSDLYGYSPTVKKCAIALLFLSHLPQAGLRSLPAMQCDFCDSKATVFFTQIIDGVTKKSNLCDTCAAGKGVTDPDGFLLDSLELPSPIISPDELADMLPSPNAPIMDDKTCCPGCGFAFEDLKKTGRLGCSKCYEFFREEIKHNLGGMHKGTKHSGRVPQGMLEAFQKRQQLEALEKEMTEAIDAEDYEKAAGIRDQINQLEEVSLTPDS